MFAVLKTGGKQYRVREGDILRVEKLAAEAGETVQFDEILMIGGGETKIGTPFVSGAGVRAQVLDQIKGEKVIHFVKRRRKHSSKRTKGHRQRLTLLKVTSILSEGAVASGKARPAPGAAPKPAKQVPKVAPKPAKQAPKAAQEAPKKAEAAGGTPKKGGTASKPKAAVKDDLKKIAGIGPKMAESLNASGIHAFEQIAAWTGDDIVAMNEKLSLKGDRIKRENWVEQAKALVAEKE